MDKNVRGSLILILIVTITIIRIPIIHITLMIIQIIIQRMCLFKGKRKN